MSDPIAAQFELGTWVGRGQALGLVANHCLAAQAANLRDIHQSGAYKTLGLTWDEFCQQHVGLTRQRVDGVIQNLAEFGETYFRLSRIIPVSPDAYRRIAPKIDGENLEIDGQLVAIVPENAVRIRDAVLRMRNDLQMARKKIETLSTPAINDLRDRIEQCLWDMFQMAIRIPPPDQQTALHRLLAFTADYVAKISQELEPSNAPGEDAEPPQDHIPAPDSCLLTPAS